MVSPNAQRPLYASKHNGFISFKSVQDDPNLQNKIVAFDQLAKDLQRGNVPNYSHIILNQCHEMHGLEECPQYGSVKNICEPKTLVETSKCNVSTYVNTNGIESVPTCNN
ncbi:alkaline phosphatase family protein [Plectonema radiosum NIES-515]|uniref:Alkaline phosphatase family protein n=1 Tax=Plectonema radiosum NIES-515 TaxID=2986073 RepID=A0ABT3B2I0_9CYAN|nr:alkaline phosphatase family protein [Plectonema radiosum NIES-515]